MKFLALFTLFVALVSCAPLLKVAEPIENEYIVVFHDNTTHTQKTAHLNRIHRKRDNFTEIHHVWEHALNGYAGKLHPSIVHAALSDPLVKYVEQNGVVRASACVTQSNAPSWGIKRISLASPVTGNTNFNYPSEAGSGVTAYIIDTGIYLANQDFEGRAIFGFQALNTGTTDDKNGHGTHVASTVGGRLYGVAKKVTLVAVKVLGDNGSGSNTGVISGVDYVRTTNGGKKAVANMSLGGGFSQALNDAVNNLANSGIPIAVAAGNDNKDSANYSPASAAQAITVGSTAESSSGGTPVDTRSSFSNFGAGVDVWAPGSSITAAWIGSVSAVNTISGTSMASPHVCGVAAVLLSKGVVASSVKGEIVSSSKKGLINLSNCNGVAACTNSKNNFLYMSC